MVRVALFLTHGVCRCSLLLQTEQHGLLVCRSVTAVSPAKTAEPIEMPIGLRTRVAKGAMC